jgi:hypothetical protein
MLCWSSLCGNGQYWGNSWWKLDIDTLRVELVKRAITTDIVVIVTKSTTQRCGPIGLDVSVKNIVGVDTNDNIDIDINIDTNLL